jgi:hypothetical protein
MWIEVANWIFRIAAIVYSVFMTICYIKKKKANNSSATVDISEIISYAIDCIKTVESAFSNIIKEDAKAGEMKRFEVLSFIEHECQIKGVEFNYEFWSKFVDDTVSVMNINKLNSEVTETKEIVENNAEPKENVQTTGKVDFNFIKKEI